jgi:hypothetical protein
VKSNPMCKAASQWTKREHTPFRVGFEIRRAHLRLPVQRNEPAYLPLLSPLEAAASSAKLETCRALDGKTAPANK